MRFETVETGVLQAGTTQTDVRARALEPGSAGNVAAGTILTMAVAPVGVSRCTNPEAFSGGTDPEDDETLRARVLETYRRMPNGANAAFYQQGALSFEEVAAATVIPRPGRGNGGRGGGHAAGVPDAGLLEALTDYFEERREIAVDLQVRAPTAVTVNLVLSVQPQAGLLPGPVLARVEEAMETWFDGTMLGQDVLLARIGQRLFQVEGVANYAIEGPSGDVSIDEDELPVLGTLSVEEM